MADSASLKSVEDRLNGDAKLRERFLKDPVEVLKSEGVHLTPEQEKSVRAQFADLGGAKVPVEGSIVIEIRISIRF